MFRSPLKKKARRSGFGDYRAFKFSVYAMTNEFFPDLRTVRLDEPAEPSLFWTRPGCPGRRLMWSCGPRSKYGKPSAS